MPIYSLQCETCGAEAEEYIPLFDDPNPPCKCGGARVRVWGITRHVAKSVFPYVTSNITGQPVEVRSEAHLQELCKAAGVTHRPDAAWIEKGVEATGRGPKWKEGSGMGLPGCWFSLVIFVLGTWL